MYSPLEQFKVEGYLMNYFNILISNHNIYLLISSILLIIILEMTFLKKKIIQNRVKTILLNLWMNINTAFDYNKYKPFLFSLFLFILINNLFGLIPYSFATTSQLIFTFTLSITIWISVTLIGLFKHGFSFFTLFIPSGVPSLLLPFIFLIEIVSYLSRILSLAVRLSCNIISGHCLLTILSSLGLLLPPFLLFFPILFLTGIFILELAVSFIQAYVFTLLTLTYIKDVEYLH